MSNKATINTFTDGINKDVDRSLLSNKSYLDAQNFRMVTTKGNTTGSLETIKGNKLISTSLIANGQFIIGSCEIRDTIILFTTNNTGVPTAGRSMIYSFTVDLKTEVGTTPVVLYDDNLNGSNGYLLFSTLYPIKTIGRYETPNIQKVYWTDGYNNIRYINIAPTVYLTVSGDIYVVTTNPYMSVDKFEFLPKFGFTKPTLKNIVGGKINTGMIAYAYQLYTSGGAETAISALSDPIHVVSDNDFLPNTLLYTGDAESINSGKGFIIEVVNTNTGYNRLRLIRVEYSTLNSIPKISIANEIAISTAASTIQVTDTGDILGELTIDEFNISSTELFTCQDIESKDNRLFVANINKRDFVTDDGSGTSVDDWDARAVRFSNMIIEGGTLISANVDDSDPIQGMHTIMGSYCSSPTDWKAAYPKDHDGINSFNNPDNDSDTWPYKFQANGTTLGAEGLNIKIDFGSDHFYLDTSNDNTTFYTTPPTDSIDLSYHNYASPWKDGKLSWQRDEVYRLFVVFGNNRGQVADPKWICDLRMPSFHDDSFTNSSGDPVYPNNLASKDIWPNTVVSSILYPRIYFKSFPTNATYAQIYRVKRERVDRSVVTQGIALSVFDDGTATPTNVYRSFGVDAVYNPILSKIGLIKLISPEINITKNISKQANDYIEYITLFDNVGFSSVSTSGSVSRNLYKLKNNTLVPFTTNTRSDINDTVMVAPESLAADYITLDSKKYSNYRSGHSILVAKGCTGLLVSYSNASWSGEGTPYAIVNYKSNVYGSQYGGYTYEDRMNNISIPCSDIIKSTGTWTDISYGDTFINYFDASNLLFDLAVATADDSMSESVYIPLESSINCDLRYDTSSTHLTWSNNIANFRQEYLGSHGTKFGAGWIYEQEKDLYLYNTVYSQQLDIKYAISFSIDRILETEFDCMIKASNVKSNGEMSESWSKFGINEYIEVDSKYGPINALHNFNNTLYYWQDKGFGMVSVNERSLIKDNSSAQLVLGTGGILDRYDYISYHVGSKDKFSVVSSIVGLFWFDKMSKSIYKFSTNLSNLTKTKYIQSYMTTTLDDDFKAIAHADIHNDEILFTFFKETVTNGFTISFNEPMDAFISFYGFVPTIYIPYQHRYLTTTNQYYRNSTYGAFDRNYLFLHDSDLGDRCYFYGLTTQVANNYVDSTLEILFNPEYEYTKVFDSFFYISNTYKEVIDSGIKNIFADTFDLVQCYNDFQNTGVVQLMPGSFSTPSTNIMRRERGWTLSVPRNIVSTDISLNPDITNVENQDPNQLFKERMRDKYLIAYLTYVNGNRYGDYDRFVISNVGLHYRVSVR